MKYLVIEYIKYEIFYEIDAICIFFNRIVFIDCHL
jgi:hypothetical protein